MLQLFLRNWICLSVNYKKCQLTCGNSGELSSNNISFFFKRKNCLLSPFLWKPFECNCRTITRLQQMIDINVLALILSTSKNWILTHCWWEKSRNIPVLEFNSIIFILMDSVFLFCIDWQGSARFSKEKETKIFAEVREVKSSQVRFRFQKESMVI